MRSMPMALYLYVLQPTVQVGVWAWHKCQGLINKYNVIKLNKLAESMLKPTFGVDNDAVSLFWLYCTGVCHT